MSRRVLPMLRMWRVMTICLGVAWASATGRAGGELANASDADGQLIGSVAAVGMVVTDLDRSLRFYEETLGFELEGVVEQSGDAFEREVGVFGARARRATLRLGAERVELTEFVSQRGLAMPEESRSNDRWFQHIAIVVSDMRRAYERLREHRVTHASSGPQALPAWNQNAGGIEAFYFKDPDGHVLEVIHFPSGKGDPRWQEPSDRLFLGIDHTAIVVADTEKSLAFYRDTLGMRVAGSSENFGVEQEHLNGVFGARLRITSLRAERGIGVEFLEYLSPSDGREYPPATRSSDVWSWRTVVTTSSSDAAAALRRVHARWVSAGAAADGSELPEFIVRDPDGHAVDVKPGEGVATGSR